MPSRLRRSSRGSPRRIFDALDVQETDRGLDRFINFALLGLIVANVVAVILETVASLWARDGDAFNVLEAVSVGVFTVEYLLRIWTCVEDPRYAHPGAAAWRSRSAPSP